jgi:hypothetical protein
MTISLLISDLVNANPLPSRCTEVPDALKALLPLSPEKIGEAFLPSSKSGLIPSSTASWATYFGSRVVPAKTAAHENAKATSPQVKEAVYDPCLKKFRTAGDILSMQVAEKLMDELVDALFYLEVSPNGIGTGSTRVARPQISVPSMWDRLTSARKITPKLSDNDWFFI